MPIRDWKAALNRFAIEFVFLEELEDFHCDNFLDTNFFTDPFKIVFA